MKVLRTIVAVLALGVATASAAETKWYEGAGVARAEPGEGATGPGRQAALAAALAEAVQNAAVELLAAEEAAAGKPPSDPAALRDRAAKALGADPSVYVSRFQIREDRGVRPRLLLADPEAKAEYQMVLVAQVDVARVRQRVGGREPAPSPKETAPDPAEPRAPETAASAAESAAPTAYRVEVEGIGAYSEFVAIRDALATKLGATRALPVEVSRGKAVFAVEAPLPANGVPAALAKALGSSVPIELAGPVTPERVPLRVRAQKPPLALPSGLTR